MKKNQLYIIIGVLVVGQAAWLGYKYFYAKKDSAVAQEQITAQAFTPNSCWIYHEYVYRVDFRDTSIHSFLFIRNADGTFSPSLADSSANHIIGNGFIIDSTGACATTEKLASPWTLSEEQQKPLKEMVDGWLDSQENLTDRDYHITGQTVALFVVLNNPKDFIDYKVSAAAPGQEGYSVIYPSQKTRLSGIQPGISFQAGLTASDAAVLQVLKTTFDENNTEDPIAKTTVDSIIATTGADGYLANIKVMKGDEFFYEGATVFDSAGKCLGNLCYNDKKWKLIQFASFVQNAPAYKDDEAAQQWEYDKISGTWRRI